MLLLFRTLDLSTRAEGNFSDVDSKKFYFEAVGIAKKLGITHGIGENRFDPEGPITREEMMTLTTRGLKLAQRNLVPGTHDDLNGFSDRSTISAYALDSVETLIKNKIISGKGMSVKPLGYATRAETAMLIYRIYNQQ